MKNTKALFKVLVVSVFLVLSFATFCFARNIGEFSDFEVPTYGWSETSKQVKVHDYEYYVINLTETKSGEEVRHCIVNSDGEMRSKIGIVSTGDRAKKATTAKAGYYYALQMQRYGYKPGTIRVYGSWSPDYRN